MKKLPILLVSILLSCGYRAPIIGGESPFIISEISKYNDTHSKYYAGSYKSGKSSSGMEGLPMMILPTGLYQINDTITIKCFE